MNILIRDIPFIIMRGNLMISVVFLLTYGITFGQNKIIESKSINYYKVWIKTDAGQTKGFLYKIDDKGVLVSKRKNIEDNQLLFVALDRIKSIKLRRHGRVLRSAAIGLLGGAVLGAGIGYAQGNDASTSSLNILSTREEKAGAGAIVLGIPGGIIGALVGTGRKSFEIKEANKDWIDALQLYSIHYQMTN